MVPEVSVHPHHPAERAELFSAPDGGAIEEEFGEFVQALVRAFKPQLVLETGAYLGSGARNIALACRRNGFGKVITLDLHEGNVARARAALAQFPEAQVVHANSLDFIRGYDGPPFGLAVLDSELHARVEELKLLRDRKLLCGPAFIHDTSRYRAAGGMPDWPDYPAALDALGITNVECPLSRGWRLFQL